MERAMNYESNNLNLKDTELRLAPPGTEEPEKQAPVGAKTNKRTSSDMDDKNEVDQGRNPPANRAQVVGWPPVRSYRKNCLQAKKSESEASGMYVKVSMDGAPYLRKIDLSVYESYPELVKAMENMFKCSIGVCLEREGHNGSEYVPTYEDKDGDWMLVGDVPWEMFDTSCRRLRVMKASEAKGFACP
ncbi:hypothetical protein NMG60_11034769 [Bertholletia excelsa]